MKAWVQYFSRAALTPDGLVPACGDRGVVVLDARNTDHTLLDDAESFNGYRRPHYPGWAVYRGPRLFDEGTARLVGSHTGGSRLLDI